MIEDPLEVVKNENRKSYVDYLNKRKMIGKEE